MADAGGNKFLLLKIDLLYVWFMFIHDGCVGWFCDKYNNFEIEILILSVIPYRITLS
jgi:hypothetical protein